MNRTLCAGYRGRVLLAMSLAGFSYACFGASDNQTSRLLMPPSGIMAGLEQEVSAQEELQNAVSRAARARVVASALLGASAVVPFLGAMKIAALADSASIEEKTHALNYFCATVGGGFAGALISVAVEKVYAGRFKKALKELASYITRRDPVQPTPKSGLEDDVC